MHSFLFIIAMAASALAQNGPQAGTIRGYITDSEKRPISNVQVTLRSRAQITDSSQTDASGQFAFNRLSLDKYLLFINAPGYVLDRAPGGSRISTSEGTGFPVEISRTHLNADVAVSLRRTTTIAGSVVDSDGKPALTGLVVLLKRSFDALGVSQLVAARPGAFVDATGQYAIDGVSEGEYFISAKSVRDRDHASQSAQQATPLRHPPHRSQPAMRARGTWTEKSAVTDCEHHGYRRDRADLEACNRASEEAWRPFPGATPPPGATQGISNDPFSGPGPVLR